MINIEGIAKSLEMAGLQLQKYDPDSKIQIELHIIKVFSIWIRIFRNQVNCT